MNKKIVFGLSIILIFFSNNVMTGQAAAAPFKVGDSYTFSVTEAVNKLTINGTDYSASQISSIPQSSTYTVSDINVDYVNLTYTDNNVNKTSESLIDEFIALYSIDVLGTVLAIGFANPTYASFQAPIPTSNSSPIIGSIPMFASGDANLYSKFSQNSTSSSTSTGGITAVPEFSYSTSSYDYNAGTSGNTFTLNFALVLTKTKSSVQFAFTVDSAFKAVVDMDRHIVTELYFKLNSDMTYGNASRVSQESFRMIEGTSGAPGFDALSLVSLLTVVSALVIIKRRRNL